MPPKLNKYVKIKSSPHIPAQLLSGHLTNAQNRKKASKQAHAHAHAFKQRLIEIL